MTPRLDEEEKILNVENLKADNFIDWVESLAKNIAIPQKLSNVGVKKTDLEKIIKKQIKVN